MNDDIIYVLTGTERDIHGNTYKAIEKVTTNIEIAHTLCRMYGWAISPHDNYLDTSIIDSCTRYYTVKVHLKNNEMLFSGDVHYDNKANIDTKGHFGYWYQDAPQTIFDLHQRDYNINVIADNEYDARDIAEKQYLADVKALGIDTKDLYYDA